MRQERSPISSKASFGNPLFAQAWRRAGLDTHVLVLTARDGLEDKVRAVAGQSEWVVFRNWKNGRVITRASRAQQAVSFGVQGTTAHRASNNGLPRRTAKWSDIASAGNASGSARNSFRMA